MRADFIKNIEKFYASGIDLIRKKNADYATEADPWRNFRFAEMVGVRVERAILVRVSDKLARISNLLDRKGKVEDETIDDTLLDCCNYLAILHAHLNEKKEKRTGKVNRVY